MEAPKKPEPAKCGAKLRNGKRCSASPEMGKKRCFKHGGAPRSGAPKGNSNAFKRGTYTDGRSGASETRLAKMLETVMTSIARDKLTDETVEAIVSESEHARGLAVAKNLRVSAMHLDKLLRQGKRMEPLLWSTQLGRRDALRALLREPTWFESEQNFKRGVSVTFHARLLARKRLKDDARTDRLTYSLAWGRLCGGLYLDGWPKDVPGAKANEPKAQS
jgi:hypothetical protein